MRGCCADCNAWKRCETPPGDSVHDLKGLTEYGRCRAHPPAAGSDEWPFTHETAWCREWAPIVQSIMADVGDTRPGAAMVEIEDNGIITVTHHNGETLELSALDGLTEADKQVLTRLAWA